MATTASAKNWKIGDLIACTVWKIDLLACTVFTAGICLAGASWHGDTVDDKPITFRK